MGRPRLAVFPMGFWEPLLDARLDPSAYRVLGITLTLGASGTYEFHFDMGGDRDDAWAGTSKWVCASFQNSK